MCNSCHIFKLSGHYLRNRSTLDIGVLGYIGIVQHKEQSPEVLSIPPGTPCVYMRMHAYIQTLFDFTQNCIFFVNKAFSALYVITI